MDHTTTTDKIQAARTAFPDWDISEVFPGFEATPKDVPVLRASDIDALVLKLRAYTDQEAAAMTHSKKK